MSQFEEQPQTDTNEAHSRSQSAGAILSARRQELGMSVEDVAAQLKLAKRQVEALEQDRFDALPGNTFVRGFVRNYARLLQIDPQVLLSDLATRLPAEAPQAALPRLQDEAMPMLRPSGAGRTVPSTAFFAVVLFAAACAGGVWFYLNNRHEPQLTMETMPPNAVAPVSAAVQADVVPDTGVAKPADGAPLEQGNASTRGENAVPTPIEPSPSPVPVVSSSVNGAPTTVDMHKADARTAVAVVTSTPSKPPAMTQTSPATTQTATVESGTSAEVRVVAKADSWVQIIDADGKHLISEVVKAGDSRSASGRPPYQVKIGNGPKTELYYKGQLTDLSTHLKVDVATLELK